MTCEAQEKTIAKLKSTIAQQQKEIQTLMATIQGTVCAHSKSKCQAIEEAMQCFQTALKDR